MNPHALRLSVSLVAAASLVVLTAACSPQKFGLAPQSDQFAQSVKYDANVDVVWVVDSSGSMAPRQAALAAQMPALFASMAGKGLTWRMAATTMDMSASGERGAFLRRDGGPPWVEYSQPDALSRMMSRLQPGATGSPMERGRHALKAAFSSPNSDGPNAGFLRAQSLLVAVFLSDEEDQSANDDYLGFLNRIRPPLANGQRGWMADFVGVVPDDPECKTTQWNDFSPGTKYIDLARASGGVVESVCGANLSKLVASLQARILEVITAYRLSTAAQPDTVRVRVNGSPVPADPANGWTYDNATTSVIFHGAAIPPAGARIQVDYDPQGAS